MHSRAIPRSRIIALTALVSFALIVGTVPSVANAAGGDSAAETGAAAVGGFALGDQLEAMIDERDGALQVELPIGPITLTWDSRRLPLNPHGFGPGWQLSVASIDTDGGVRVVPAKGGVFEMDASQPSGLAGYGTADVVFKAEPGELPARAGAEASARTAYAYALHELGGQVTYFSEAGDPVARTSPTGRLTEWVWHDDVPHRLLATIDPDGVETRLTWDESGEHVSIERGANLGGDHRLGVWRLALDPEHLEVTDPEGGVLRVTADASGLISRVSGASGAETIVDWQRSADGVARVDRVRTLDTEGTELSIRSWAAANGVASTGWPVADVATGIPAQGFETAISDGSSRVVSSYDAEQRVTSRKIEVTTASGTRVIQDQEYGYSLAGPSQPTSTAVVHRDAHGDERRTTTSSVLDEFGRVVEQTAPDGSVTRTSYDDEVGGSVPGAPARPERLVPVGLPVSTRVTAPDGLVTETRYTLNPERTAVVTEVTASGAAAEVDAGTVPTRRVEFTVEPDGFVSAERVYPQTVAADAAGATDAAGAGAPLVTERERVVDLERGTMTTTETVAAGTDAAATTQTITSLAHGQVVASRDPVGNVTETSYDALGRVVGQVDAAGGRTEVQHQTMQLDGRNATSTTGPDGVRTTEERDALGRTTRITDNVDRGRVDDTHTRVVETREYVGAATVRSTDAWGATSTSTKDVLGRVISTTAPTGLTELIEYDDLAGTKTTSLTPTGRAADAEFARTETIDEQGRVVSGSGTRSDEIAVPETAHEYDGLGRLAAVTDERTTTRAEFDEYGNQTTTTITPQTGAPTVATRRFDERGAVEQKTLTSGDGDERSGHATTFDALGRAVTDADAVGRTMSFRYTPDGLTAEVRRADGSVTVNEYDDRTRRLVRTRTTHPTAPAVAQERGYDPVTGRLTSVFDPDSPETTTIRYDYDDLGNLLRTTYPDGSTIEHEYDEHGRKVATTDVAGSTTRFTYTDAGLMETAVQRDAGSSPDAPPVAEVRYSYDAFGRVVELVRGNGLSTTIGYTSASEVASEETRTGDALHARRDYEYSPEGNLTLRTDTTYDGDVPTSTTTAYTYDAHDRLLSSQIHDGASTGARVLERTDYVLNVAGDILQETVTTEPGTPAGATTVRGFSYSPTGELREIGTTAPDGTTTTAAQTYDTAGNLVAAADGTGYTYDALARQVEARTPEGATIATAYWADGSRRSVRTEPGAGAPAETATFYWDGDTLLNDAHAGDHTTGDEPGVASYLIGLQRQARTTNGGHATEGGAATSYYVHDRHGNVTALTDAAGAATLRYAYSDYGVATSVPADPSAPSTRGLDRNPYQYAGEFTDPTGTQFLRSRTYDAEPARFTNVDPMGMLNRYGFGDANPIMRVDPTGNTAEADWINGLIIGATALFAALTLASAAVIPGGIWAIGPIGGAGLFSDFGGMILGALNMADDRHSFMPENVKEGLTYAEYGLAIAGFIGVGLQGAPDLFEYFTKNSVKAHAKQTAQTVDNWMGNRQKSYGEFLKSDFWRHYKDNPPPKAASSPSVGSKPETDAIDLIENKLSTSLEDLNLNVRSRPKETKRQNPWYNEVVKSVKEVSEESDKASSLLLQHLEATKNTLEPAVYEQYRTTVTKAFPDSKQDAPLFPQPQPSDASDAVKDGTLIGDD